MKLDHLEGLEPAERNNAEILRTVVILVVVMIIGGWLIIQQYIKHADEQHPDRPPISAEIKQNFSFINQDGKVVSIEDMVGKVWFTSPIALGQLDERNVSLEVMQRLAKDYADNDKVMFVSISVEGEDLGITQEKLKAAADQLNIDSSKWWIITSKNTTDMHKYGKNQLRQGFVEKVKAADASEKWTFPDMVTMVDSERHIRQQYAFDDALIAQSSAEEIVAQNPEKAKIDGADYYLKAIELLESRLRKNLDYVLNESQPGKLANDETKQ